MFNSYSVYVQQVFESFTHCTVNFKNQFLVFPPTLSDHTFWAEVGANIQPVRCGLSALVDYRDCHDQKCHKHVTLRSCHLEE